MIYEAGGGGVFTRQKCWFKMLVYYMIVHDRPRSFVIVRDRS